MGRRNKNALVTGAASGIGAAMAESLAACGYRVVVNFKSNAQGAAEIVRRIQAAGGEAMPLQADVASRADAERMFQTIESGSDFSATWSTMPA